MDLENNEGELYGITRLNIKVDELTDLRPFHEATDVCYVLGSHSVNFSQPGMHLVLMRNPIDVVLSYAEVIVKLAEARGQETLAIDRVAEDYVRGPGDKYPGHQTITWNDYAERIPSGSVIIHYENMVHRRTDSVVPNMDRVGITTRAVCDPPSMEYLRSKNSYHYNQGVIGRGARELKPSLLTEICCQWYPQMERFGYSI